jgi:hypothetical protein
MKKFDFDECAKYHHKEVVDFLKENHQKKIGETFYVIAMNRIRSGLTYVALNKNQRKSQKRLRQPAKLRKEYRHLKERFGFFQ